MFYGSEEHNEFAALLVEVNGTHHQRFATEFEQNPEGAWERMETANHMVGFGAQIAAFQHLCENPISGITQREEEYRIKGKALASRIQELGDAGYLELNENGRRVLNEVLRSLAI